MTAFHEHLDDRGLKPWIKSWVDDASEAVTFPLYHGGIMVGYQRYRWMGDKSPHNKEHGRYYTWISEAYRTVTLYGTDNCCGHGPLFVTEGVWDALRVTACWVDCVALLTCSPHHQLKQWLRMYAGRRPIVLLADSDGKMGEWGDYRFLPPDGAKDANELSHERCFEWVTKIKEFL